MTYLYWYTLTDQKECPMDFSGQKSDFLIYIDEIPNDIMCV